MRACVGGGRGDRVGGGHVESHVGGAPLAHPDPNPWWGPGEPKEDNTAITQFKIDIPEKVNKWVDMIFL